KDTSYIPCIEVDTIENPTDEEIDEQCTCNRNFESFKILEKIADGARGDDIKSVKRQVADLLNKQSHSSLLRPNAGLTQSAKSIVVSSTQSLTVSFAMSFGTGTILSKTKSSFKKSLQAAREAKKPTTAPAAAPTPAAPTAETLSSQAVAGTSAN
ncbi:hypothetical protein MPER_05673, partial [Moniliophthora perniciosa FA553]